MTYTPDLSKLVGAKLVRVADLPMGQDVKESVIKALEQAHAPNVRLLEGSDGFFEMLRRNWLSHQWRRVLRVVMRQKTSRGL